MSAKLFSPSCYLIAGALCVSVGELAARGVVVHAVASGVLAFLFISLGALLSL